MNAHRIPPRLALLVSLSLSLSFALAHAAEGAPKGPDVQTVGGVTSVVTSTPVCLPPSPPVTPATTSATRMPMAAAPTPAQLEKLAALLRETAAHVALLAPPEGKLPTFDATSPEEPGAATPRWRSLASALGPLPRPEWGTGRPVKPADVMTIGPPTGIDHVNVPAPPTRAGAPIVREPDFGTSRPRDPSLPPPSPVKPAADAPRPGDRP